MLSGPHDRATKVKATRLLGIIVALFISMNGLAKLLADGRGRELCRDAAATASRELLAKHAGKLVHNVRIEADVCPENEWPAHVGQEPGVGDEDAPAGRRSPLVHPVVAATDFANVE